MLARKSPQRRANGVLLLQCEDLVVLIWTQGCFKDWVVRSGTPSCPVSHV